MNVKQINWQNQIYPIEDSVARDGVRQNADGIISLSQEISSQDTKINNAGAKAQEAKDEASEAQSQIDIVRTTIVTHSTQIVAMQQQIAAIIAQGGVANIWEKLNETSPGFEIVAENASLGYMLIIFWTGIINNVNVLYDGVNTGVACPDVYSLNSSIQQIGIIKGATAGTNSRSYYSQSPINDYAVMGQNGTIWYFGTKSYERYKYNISMASFYLYYN